MRHLLGLDVSTTATKALLVDERGRVVGIASSAHRLDTPRPLAARWGRGRHLVERERGL